MTFEEWWKKEGRGFSKYCIPDEIKWFSEKAWNQAVNEMFEQEQKAQANNKNEAENVQEPQNKPLEDEGCDSETDTFFSC